jgi:hypothetical protein
MYVYVCPQAAAAKVEREAAMRALEENPMDPEAQRKIQAMIDEGEGMFDV